MGAKAAAMEAKAATMEAKAVAGSRSDDVILTIRKQAQLGSVLFIQMCVYCSYLFLSFQE